MKNLKVLIIDDEQRAIHALTRVLANFSQVEIVGTFLDALSARAFLAQHSVDCLFVDIEMPELDGLSFAKEVKRLTPDTHIVFTT
ncbi:MAG: hypothetical protein RLY87_951, partial [Chloroflexota bacterium]